MAKWNIWKKITETISKSKTWLDGQSNAVKVLCAGAMSVIIFVLAYLAAIRNSDSNSVGYWNFIILIVSAPVAFVIWHFRDENNRQQIENQRKDINLKEFQKLSEWVSGVHLPEIKTVSKTTQKSSSKDGAEITEQTMEQSEEYAKKPDAADFDTFSKREGAVALQISAIYNLLPFFRGDYGESFRLPAFNLLKSAWQAMQQDSLNQLEVDNLSDEKRTEIIVDLVKKANRPIGVALTHILLSLNQGNTKLNLRDFPEMLPNICLAGMNFSLGGVSEIAKDLSGLNLNGIDLRGSFSIEVQFQGSQLFMAKLQYAQLSSVNFQNADLSLANLQNADLQNADLRECQFEWTQLKHRETLSFAKITVKDFIEKIYPDWKEKNDSEWEALTEDEQTKVMQQFCNETGMRIFDEEGKRIIPPL
ncbi:pentapeptide repeat-containing protein [Neisseria oralis]|uniref:Pentapeptide repeat-containing protein n=1 Tax=Neisseria oralis TaxID=1107316 RepID=A0ABW8Q635_9NEIS